MGSIAFSYPYGNPSFSRGYVVGFSAHTGCDHFRLSGQHVLFDVSGYYYYDLLVTDEFYPASTNSYTLDHVFDAVNCWVRDPFGNPVFAVMIPGIVVSPGEFVFRIGMDGGLAQNPAYRADLAEPPYVWRP